MAQQRVAVLTKTENIAALSTTQELNLFLELFHICFLCRNLTCHRTKPAMFDQNWAS